MTVLVPTALALLAIALPITVLYILKLRMRQVHVSSDLFWQQIFQARPPRSFWNRFRHPLSWLTQILILLTIVAAAADPRWLSGVPQRNLVIILDTSASMQAREASGQRLTLAANQARQIINGLPPGTQAAVIAADQHPEV
ncbi:MAG: BatA domain-containing protein, partial [Planctomycetaceae bacterium]